MPLFGRSKEQGNKYTHMGLLRKLSDVFLSSEYLLAFDQYRNIYMYVFDS